jgi:predicted Zn-dependent protease
MKFYLRYIVFVFVICAGKQAVAQSDDVLLKAMQDELSRNMNELKLPDFDKPFFIMYGIIDQKNHSIAASLGSLVQSTTIPFRFKSTTRVLVGDYEFNDESLEESSYSQATAIEIPLPIDDDYLGIRRSFWSTTDNVYRNAAKHFAKHKETVKESQKALADVPHRSFAKAAPVKKILNATPVSFQKEEWENKLRRLSALFLGHTYILNSAVAFDYTTGYRYLANSEGTVVKTPISEASILIIARMKNEKGEFLVEQYTRRAVIPDQLPSEKELTDQIEKMIANFKSAERLPTLEEEYTGPVLLMGPTVADVFTTALLRGRESIMANDNISKLDGYQFNNANGTLETKIGKTVFNDLLTIKARPKLTSFNGTPLLGSYMVDDEGIEPPEELIVAEKGVLKTLLNNRTTTNKNQTANGFSSGPGVLEIRVAQKDSDNALKEKLIAKAKSDGLDYAIIIYDMAGYNLKVSKIYVTDGREEFVRNVAMNPTVKSLKKILGASEKYNAYNLGANGRGGIGGNVFSIIVPDALLIEELELRPINMPTLTEEEFVSNPLIKN